MKRLTLIGAVCGIATAVIFHCKDARATWPSGGSRSISGAGCYVAYSSGGIVDYECPFISDSNGYWGQDVGNIFVDYDETHVNSGFVDVMACWQSYTGSSTQCATSVTSSSGYHDEWVPGFGTLSSSEDPTDYFYVQLIADVDTVNTIYGVAYGP